MSGKMSETWPHHTFISKKNTPDSLTCQVNCRIEGQCEFYIFDVAALICHIGRPSEQGNQSMAFANPSELGINVNGIDTESLLNDMTVSRTTRREYYYKFGISRHLDVDAENCMLLCRYDRLQHCDFFIPMNFTFVNGNGNDQRVIDCVLGDFDDAYQNSALQDYSKYFEARIFKGKYLLSHRI